MKNLTVACIFAFTVLVTGCDASFILNGEEINADNLIPVLLKTL